MSAEERDASVAAAANVLRCRDVAADDIGQLIGRYGARSVPLAEGEPIPGSHWGAPEAGLVAEKVHWRADTPLHSLLHELAHLVCMDASRRSVLDTNAGGDDDEECAVCYLEVLLAEALRGFGRERCLRDMDAWCYSFREGSARAWFEGDGRDARDWLSRHGLIDADERPTWRLRS